jgi:DNA-binding GntR family transcriptional regulator
MARHAGVERRSLEAQAADVLRDRIVSGTFSPGDRLTEERLAERLEISRGTPRSAAEGLAARLVAARITPSKARTLRGAFPRLADAARAGNRTAVVAADEVAERLSRERDLVDGEALVRPAGVAPDRCQLGPATIS